MYIGNHLASSKGLEIMGKEAISLGANTFAFFTRKSGTATQAPNADGPITEVGA